MLENIDCQTILYAEDEAPVRKLITKIMTENGFRVIEAENGEEAKEIYEKQSSQINGIVSDLKMPKMNGVEFAKYNYKNMFLPFMVCTAMDDATLALELLEYGVQDYVVKPVEEKEFIATINNALYRRQLGNSDLKQGGYAGNVESLTLPSKMENLRKISQWVRDKVEDELTGCEISRFTTFVDNFLMNAHEHGNLKISAEEKKSLLEEGMYEIEVELRESSASGNVKVDVSVLPGEIAVSICDDGYGFDYGKYLEMNDDDFIESLNSGIVNSKGIFMAKRFFDEVHFSKGGAKVQLKKKLS